MSAGKAGVLVRLDGLLAARTTLLALVFLWPLLVYGHPAVFSDSSGYYHGGQVAVDTALNKLRDAVHRPSASAANTARRAAPVAVHPAGDQQLKAGRSVAYSILVYLLRVPGETMFALVAVQSLMTGFVIACFAAAFGRLSHIRLAVIGLLGAFVTPVAVEVCFVMPDLLGGLMVAALILLATRHDALSKPVTGALILIAALGFAAHAGNPPLALGLAAAAGIWMVGWSRERLFARLSLLALPLMLGAAITVLAGVLAFQEIGLGAGRFPLTLARLIDNGPGKLYLDKHCPTEHYAVCEVFHNRVPSTIYQFLWAKNGLRYRATADQMRRIRVEETTIVWRATLAHPKFVVEQSVTDTARQVVMVGLKMISFDVRLTIDPSGVPAITRTGQSLAVRDTVDLLSQLTLILCLMVLIARFRDCAPNQKVAIILLVIALLMNAAISAIFSGVTGRYQSRIIWLLPFMTALFLNHGPSAWRRRLTPTHPGRPMTNDESSGQL